VEAREQRTGATAHQQPTPGVELKERCASGALECFVVYAVVHSSGREQACLHRLLSAWYDAACLPGCLPGVAVSIVLRSLHTACIRVGCWWHAWDFVARGAEGSWLGHVGQACTEAQALPACWPACRAAAEGSQQAALKQSGRASCAQPAGCAKKQVGVSKRGEALRSV